MLHILELTSSSRPSWTGPGLRPCPVRGRCVRLAHHRRDRGIRAAAAPSVAAEIPLSVSPEVPARCSRLGRRGSESLKDAARTPWHYAHSIDRSEAAWPHGRIRTQQTEANLAMRTRREEGRQAPALQRERPLRVEPRPSRVKTGRLPASGRQGRAASPSPPPPAPQAPPEQLKYSSHAPNGRCPAQGSPCCRPGPARSPPPRTGSAAAPRSPTPAA